MTTAQTKLFTAQTSNVAQTNDIVFILIVLWGLMQVERPSLNWFCNDQAASSKP